MNQPNHEESDEHLMLKVQNGDRLAYAALVQRHTNRFFATAYRMIGQQDLAEDVVQESFLKLWVKARNWDPDKGTLFTTWFTRIVMNTAHDFGRKMKNYPLSVETAVLDTMIDKISGEEENLELRQRQIAIEKAIQSLPERQKKALNLCFYENMGNKEAASILGVGVKALESLLMRAKSGVRDALIRQGFLEG